MNNYFNPSADGEILKAAPLTPSLADDEAVEGGLVGRLDTRALLTALEQLLARRSWSGAMLVEELGRSYARGVKSLELAELETKLHRVPGAREAVAIVREDPIDDPRIVAYVRAVNNASRAPAAMFADLERRMPRFGLGGQSLLAVPLCDRTRTGWN